MSDTMIQKCGCQNEYQDERYGKGQRVHNIGAGGKASCTVCHRNHRNERAMSCANATDGLLISHGAVLTRRPPLTFDQAIDFAAKARGQTGSGTCTEKKK